jgi:hypothetical protein
VTSVLKTSHRMSFSHRLEGLAGDPPKIMCTSLSSPGYTAPAPSSLSGGAPLPGLVHRSWLEGVVDIVLHEPSIPERMLDEDLMVRAWCV